MQNAEKDSETQLSTHVFVHLLFIFSLIQEILIKYKLDFGVVVGVKTKISFNTAMHIPVLKPVASLKISWVYFFNRK
jgi:hypothetical protein